MSTTFQPSTSKTFKYQKLFYTNFVNLFQYTHSGHICLLKCMISNIQRIIVKWQVIYAMPYIMCMRSELVILKIIYFQTSFRYVRWL